MEKTLITDVSELDSALKNAVKTAIREMNEEAANANNDRLYTINQVRKRLGKAHATVSKLISKGFIKTTKNGLISEAALNEFLQKA